MKIFITQTAFPPSVGGAQSHMHQLGRQLSKRIHIQVASFWATNRTDWLLGTTWFAPGGKAYTISDIPVTPISLSLREKLRLSPWVTGYYLWQSLSIRKIAETLLPKLRKLGKDTDLIHHGRIGREPLGFASLALARERSIPFVMTPFHHPRWNSRFYHNYHRLYRQADAIIALTPAEVEMLVALGVKRERIFVTGTGAVLSETYDPQAFREKYGIHEPFVLFLGQKHLYKGFTHLVKAAPLVWKERPEVRFVFVGPPTPQSRRFFRQVSDPRIIELGKISLEEKTSALAACELLCVPSDQECFGGVYIEAWKMGKPVIGADIPAVSHVITNGVDGFIGPREPTYLAGMILELLEDGNLRQRMGEAGRIKADQYFSWSSLAQKTESVYRRVLAG